MGVTFVIEALPVGYSSVSRGQRKKICQKSLRYYSQESDISAVNP